MKLMTLLEIKRALRAGKYAWPGGYPRYFVAADGEAISFEAVRENWREIVAAHLRVAAIHSAIAHSESWAIAGVDINWEDEGLFCAHTGEAIECAYPSK